MTRVITYGTYDLLHYGHIRLLERAKALGDYLIVGVTADDFDKTRGKINVQQSLMERIEAVRALNIADEIIVEEYEGQKIEDIKKYDIDIFTVGSDWIGKFDYLKEFCKVVYLDRTEGISSSEIRQTARSIKFGLVGDAPFLNKVRHESQYVNGLNIYGICTQNHAIFDTRDVFVTDDYEKFLKQVDAVYIRSTPELHYEQIKKALNAGKHVLCESPVTINREQCDELFKIAEQKNLILMEAIKTAYATAYLRMLLLIKTGKIGEVISVDTTCTSLSHYMNDDKESFNWRCLYEWGPTALLPILQILGCEYRELHSATKYEEQKKNDIFTSAYFLYEKAVASFKIGVGVKSEGEMIISGTNGYIYVPAPWWKTDYFEIRYEDPSENKRYFYQLDGEGIRYELVSFLKSIEFGKNLSNINHETTLEIAKFMEKFESTQIIE